MNVFSINYLADKYRDFFIAKRLDGNWQVLNISLCTCYICVRCYISVIHYDITLLISELISSSPVARCSLMKVLPVWLVPFVGMTS